MNKYAPICLFTYNRLSETQQTIAALQKNELAKESDLFIFSDAAKNASGVAKVTAVRKSLKGINGFKSVTVFEAIKNKGLATSIIDGVSQIINDYGKVIVLEDDLITSPHFLTFMNRALDFYDIEKKIQSVNGYSLKVESCTSDVYFQQRPFPWGWATWKDRWDVSLFDKEELKKSVNTALGILKEFKRKCGDDSASMLLNSIYDRNDSWYIRWSFNHFRSNRFSVYPFYSLVNNIGFGEEGTHCNGINPYKSKKNPSGDSLFNLVKFKEPEKVISLEFLRYFSKKYRLQIRFHLLRTNVGRGLLKDEFKSKVFGL